MKIFYNLKSAWKRIGTQYRKCYYYSQLDMLPGETQVLPLHNCVELFLREKWLKPLVTIHPGLSGEVQTEHIRNIGLLTYSRSLSNIVLFNVVLL